MNRAPGAGEPGVCPLMASIASLHDRRVFDGRIEWAAVAAHHDRLLPLRATIGVAVARAADYLEAGEIDRSIDALAAIDRADDRPVGRATPTP